MHPWEGLVQSGWKLVTLVVAQRQR